MPSSTSRSGSKTSSSKSSSSAKSSSSKSAIRPGQEAQKDIKLFVKDSKGKTISEIVVPAGHRVPPTRSKSAESYSTKK